MTERLTRSKRELAKQARREEILCGAAAVFTERGISAATMQQIAQAAGVSKGCLYLYFESKDELFLTIALDVLEELGGQLREVDAREFCTGRQRLRQLLHTHVRYATSHPAQFQAALSWLRTPYHVDGSSQLFEDYRAGIARMQSIAARALMCGVEDGSIHLSVSPERYLIQLWGAIFGLVTLEHNSEEFARRNPNPVSTEDLALEFIDQVLGFSPSSSIHAAQESK